VTAPTTTRWQPVIGLEVHVQLATASKAFSGAPAGFGAPPNSQCDPVVLGLPGCLPVFNGHALELAIRLGLACGSRIRPLSRFARKHYFYPDLPKGYQISQYDEPLCEGGTIEVEVGGGTRAVKLRRIHLEEDAGKNMHQPGGATSQVDLNRAGVPLIEVVSEPDLFSADEAAEYMRVLRQLCRWLDISGGDMEKGQLRCDANVSLRPVDSDELGTRAELKNINSFKFVHHAIEHEIARQARILDQGGQVVQETRLWDAVAGLSHSMRSKEEAMDYRYFPDPDLPPLAVDEPTIGRVRASLPELPGARRARYRDMRLSDDDARQLVADRAVADRFDAALTSHGGGPAAAKPIANWILSEKDPAASRVEPTHVAELVRLIEAGTISGQIGKEVWAEVAATGDAPSAIVERRGLTQVRDEGALEAACAEVIAANPSEAASYRAGKAQLIGFFVGQVMKRTGGRADPKLVNQILRRLLGEAAR
jgi:aspartyl-tRNA(Asn)/glutamyl-tRNA(Gln) amidotransferase subunit B